MLYVQYMFVYDMDLMFVSLGYIILLIISEESSQTKRAQADAEPKTESVELSDNPVVISEALAKFLDAEGREMLATDAERRVWEYIKLNHLEVRDDARVCALLL